MAWSPTNPTTNALPGSPRGYKETALFGARFLERATKRIEKEKTLAKVTGVQPVPPAKHRQQDWNPTDLHCSLENGAPAFVLPLKLKELISFRIWMKLKTL